MTDGSRLADRALQIALGQRGVRETSRNRGPMVDVYVRDGGGLDPAGRYPWCVAFVVFALRRAAAELGMTLPPKAASVGKLWHRYNDYVTSIPSPGAVFMHLSDPTDIYSPGHVGFVVSVRGDELETVEGNTDVGGGREGDGVYMRTRPLSYANHGFVDLAKSQPERASHA